MGDIQNVRGLSQIRTLQNSEQRSLPPTNRSVNLEAYLLTKKLDLLDAEEARLLKRLETVQGKQKSTREALEKAEYVILQKYTVSSKTQTQRNKTKWKTKTINY